MMLDVVQTVQEFLHRHEGPPASLLYNKLKNFFTKFDLYYFKDCYYPSSSYEYNLLGLIDYNVYVSCLFPSGIVNVLGDLKP